MQIDGYCSSTKGCDALIKAYDLDPALIYLKNQVCESTCKPEVVNTITLFGHKQRVCVKRCDYNQYYEIVEKENMCVDACSLWINPMVVISGTPLCSKNCNSGWFHGTYDE